VAKRKRSRYSAARATGGSPTHRPSGLSPLAEWPARYEKVHGGASQ
jgi:hypothetical protein